MARNEWPQLPLAELTVNFDSIRVPVKSSERKSGPYPYYGASGVVDHVDGYLFDGEYLLIAEDGENLRTRQTPIAFAATGKFWVNNHAHIVRGNDRANTRFLMYALAQTDISGYLSGSTMPKLTQGSMNRIRVIAPSRPIQDRIVDILSALDDKIELNRRMNETLESMARALFRSWFIDFDPVRAKAAGRKPPGLDPAVAKLFPKEFETSLLGKIPAGWKVAKLAEHVEAVKGLSYKGEGLADSGVPLHNLNSVREGGGYKFEGLKRYTGEFRERHAIHPGDLIVTNTEQGHDCLLIGYAAIVPKSFGDTGIYSHHLYRVRVLKGSPTTPDFLCELLNSPRMHDVVSGYGNGTTVNMLPADGLQQPEFVVPPAELIARYSDFAKSARLRKEELVAESKALAATRDALLPKLLSGELRVGA